MPTLTEFKQFARLYPCPETVVQVGEPEDSFLQKNLDLAQKNILIKLGKPAVLPDEPAVDRSVYLLAQFYTENWTTQEVKAMGKVDDLVRREKNTYYRANVFRAINREIDNLILPFVDVLKFMPEVSA